ncbi:hypothetical protein KP001_12150 [Geomonas subterranea]|uniref:Uncharacterized protein n=1 Tax=Geomonas subterranea TaxID=2847989 RepID=A0ABX8LB35_9BACT|nr:hypothetical protein [Geomonas subterranea]QXE89212.1 hypothetical protein KP001_12150 [Geomonas subterranea]QXM08676.1 hypothetical protein KP002_17125 [Geomonas subterranea]
MKRLILLSLFLVLVVPMTAFASLDSFLSSLNVQARADMSGFSAKVSAQFGVPTAKVQMVLQSVPEPADAFMLFQLGQYSGKPVDQVYQVYQPNKKKGWGAIAKELGIKPGSAEFHALKRGDLRLTGQPIGRGGQEDSGPGKGKGKGHGKGHNK